MLLKLRMFSFRLSYELFKQSRARLQIIRKSNLHITQKEPSCTIARLSNWKLLSNKFDILRKMCSQITINNVDFDTVRAANKSVLLIDVREPSELKETGVLPASINIPLGEVENALKNMDSKEFHLKYGHTKPELQTPIIFSCKSGKRSEMAAKTATTLGYKDVSNYIGGWSDWEEKIKQH